MQGQCTAKLSFALPSLILGLLCARLIPSIICSILTSTQPQNSSRKLLGHRKAQATSPYAQTMGGVYSTGLSVPAVCLQSNPLLYGSFPWRVTQALCPVKQPSGSGGARLGFKSGFSSWLCHNLPVTLCVLLAGENTAGGGTDKKACDVKDWVLFL